MTDLAHRLTTIILKWRMLDTGSLLRHRHAQPVDRFRPSTPPIGLSLDAGRFSAILPDLSAALRRSPLAGRSINPWTVSGAKRREVRNAGILAALWSPSQSGKTAEAFLSGFLARCDDLKPGVLPGREELAEGYRLRVEHCPGADASDRVDLVIETKRHVVGVEVKIDAVEGPEQLTRYVAAIARSAGLLGKQPVVILLAPFTPSRADVVAATWSTVRSAALASLPRRREDYDFAHHLVAHFARHVRNF